MLAPLRPAFYLGGYGLGVLLYSALLLVGIVESNNRYGLEILRSINVDSLQEEYPSISTFSVEENRHPMRTYIKFIFDHPGKYVRQRLSALANMWVWPTAANRSYAAKAFIAIRFPLFILAMVGFWRHRQSFDAWILFTPLITLTLVHVVLYSAPRYTFVVEPLLIILASASFSRNGMR